MGSIVVAMPKIEDAKKLAGVLRSRGISVDQACATGAEVLQRINSRDYGVVVCGYRLSDMNHVELQRYMPDYFDMVLLVNESRIDSCAADVVKVMLPLQVNNLVNTVDMILSQTERRLKKSKTGLKSRSEEDRKVIEDAQKILMERNGMERVEAYRYIQKKSMDTSTGMLDVAKNIIASDV